MMAQALAGWQVAAPPDGAFLDADRAIAFTM